MCVSGSEYAEYSALCMEMFRCVNTCRLSGFRFKNNSLKSSDSQHVSLQLYLEGSVAARQLGEETKRNKHLRSKRVF